MPKLIESGASSQVTCISECWCQASHTARAHQLFEVKYSQFLTGGKYVIGRTGDLAYTVRRPPLVNECTLA